MEKHDVKKRIFLIYITVKTVFETRRLNLKPKSWDRPMPNYLFILSNTTDLKTH